MGFALLIGETDVDPGRVQSIEVVQTVETEHDRLTVSMDARGAIVPPSGVRAEVWMEDAYMGGYVVSDLVWRLTDDGSSVDVLAVGADLTATGLRTPATRARPQGLTLAALVEQIAADHGYVPRVHADLAGIRLSHEDQITESDLQFLVRVADRYDADIRFGAGNLVALPRTAAETTVDVLPLDRTLGGFLALEARFSDRWDWQAVVARYYDYDQGRPITVRVGSATGSAYEVPGVQGDVAAAKAAAERARTRLAERAWVLRASTQGDPGLIPHVQFEIPAATVPDGVPLTWRILEAVHRVDGDEGFTTAIRCTVPSRPADRPEPPAVSKVSYSRARYIDPNLAYRRLVE